VIFAPLKKYAPLARISPPDNDDKKTGRKYSRGFRLWRVSISGQSLLLAQSGHHDP
jgi:hypothetical protein